MRKTKRYKKGVRENHSHILLAVVAIRSFAKRLNHLLKRFFT